MIWSGKLVGLRNVGRLIVRTIEVTGVKKERERQVGRKISHQIGCDVVVRDICHTRSCMSAHITYTGMLVTGAGAKFTYLSTLE